jgi:ATP synthase protein I
LAGSLAAMFHAFRVAPFKALAHNCGRRNMVEDEPGQVPKLGVDARLDSLEQRLEKAQATEAKRTGRAPAADANEQLGNRVLSTLIGGLVGGTLIGWVLDRLFGTGHVLLIVFMVLGTVGGFWSIFKLASQKPRADGDLKGN